MHDEVIGGAMDTEKRVVGRWNKVGSGVPLDEESQGKSP